MVRLINAIWMLFFCIGCNAQEVKFHNLKTWAKYDIYEIYNTKLKSYDPAENVGVTKWEVLYDDMSKSMLVQDSAKGEMFYFRIDSQEVVNKHKIFYGSDNNGLCKAYFFIEDNYNVCFMV